MKLYYYFSNPSEQFKLIHQIMVDRENTLELRKETSYKGGNLKLQKNDLFSYLRTENNENQKTSHKHESHNIFEQDIIKSYFALKIWIKTMTMSKEIILIDKISMDQLIISIKEDFNC